MLGVGSCHGNSLGKGRPALPVSAHNSLGLMCPVAVDHDVTRPSAAPLTCCCLGERDEEAELSSSLFVSSFAPWSPRLLSSFIAERLTSATGVDLAR